MLTRLQVLVACSDPEGRRVLAGVLTRCGLDPVYSSTVGEARAILAREPVQIVFCEAGLTDGTFRDMLRAVRGAGSKVPVVVASRVDDVREYIEAMGLGAFDYIACPYRHSEVERIVSSALREVTAAA